MHQTRRRFLASKIQHVSTNFNGFHMIDEEGAGFRKSQDLLDWSRIEWLRNRKGRLILKGLVHQEDAFRAVDASIDEVIVPNDGGRHLDAATSLGALGAIMKVISANYPVMVGAGFRLGSDVLKTVALGTEMIFLGRPMLYGGTVAGHESLNQVIGIIGTGIDPKTGSTDYKTLADLDLSFPARDGESLIEVQYENEYLRL